MSKIRIKTPEELEMMVEGGAKLAEVKAHLKREIKVGANADDIDKLAERLIEKTGGKPSFKMVPNYNWTTCVNVNEGVVHGIPKKATVFKNGDVVSVDIGLFYKGFHTDTSFTVGLNVDKNTEKFLKVGERAFNLAVGKAKAGNRIYDISQVIEDTLTNAGYSPIHALVGHGVGRELHEEPQIPCFVRGRRKSSPRIPEGAVFAIEVMYAQGEGKVHLDNDGWTISASDGTITALYEETVAVTKNGPKIITGSKN